MAALALLDGLAAPTGAAVRPLLTLLGPIGMSVLCGAVVIVAALLRRPQAAVLAVGAPVLSGGVALLLRPLIGRTLNGGEALPSGHATAAVCGALVVALAVPAIAGRRPSLRIALGAGAVAGTFVGLTLVANGLHVPSDVVAGACTAVAITVMVAVMIDRSAARLERTVSFPLDGTG